MKTSSAKIFVGPLILVGLALVSILSTVFADDNHDRGKSQANVNLWDYCDPTSFNATLGPDTCNRDTTTGAITVNGFLGELSSEKSVGAWRFSPAELKSDHRSITLTLKNVGGETHTFTKVKKFGGDFVDALNQASGNPTPAPDLATPNGRASGSRTNGSGSTPRKGPTAGRIRWATNGTRWWFPPPKEDASRETGLTSMRIRAARVPFGVWTLSATSGNGPTNTKDEHTRAGDPAGRQLLQPQGSHWYFPQAYKLTSTGKYLLMAPSSYRAATLGFRCVVDAE